MFVNDIPDLFKINHACDPVKLGNTDLNSLLYADDLVLLSESQTGLQECLSKLEIYTKKWKLKINRRKCKVLLFGTPIQRRAYLTSAWLYEENPLYRTGGASIDTLELLFTFPEISNG
jgi:hypothetical protein